MSYLPSLLASGLLASGLASIFFCTKRATCKYLLPFLLATGLAAGALGTAASSALAAGDINPALWKLSDADSEIWIFGTVHALDKNLRWRTPKIKRAFARSDSFYMEAPVGEVTPEIMGPLIKKYGLNNPGQPFFDQPFFDQVSPEGYDYFLQVLKSLGIPETAAQNFAPMRPWFVAISLATLQMQAQGLDPDSGVDKVLWEDARAEGKRLGYFESLDQQLAIFGNLSPEQDLEFFEDSMQQLVEDTDMLDDLFAYWKSGEIEQLAELMNASFGDDEKMKAALLIDRNRDWAEQIDDLMKGSGRTFIAVGAGHLGGEKSVQWYLERMGYEVVRE